jgi:hypothetical protein
MSVNFKWMIAALWVGACLILDTNASAAVLNQRLTGEQP